MSNPSQDFLAMLLALEAKARRAQQAAGQCSHETPEECAAKKCEKANPQNYTSRSIESNGMATNVAVRQLASGDQTLQFSFTAAPGLLQVLHNRDTNTVTVIFTNEMAEFAAESLGELL